MLFVFMVALPGVKFPPFHEKVELFMKTFVAPFIVPPAAKTKVRGFVPSPKLIVAVPAVTTQEAESVTFALLIMLNTWAPKKLAPGVDPPPPGSVFQLAVLVILPPD